MPYSHLLMTPIFIKVLCDRADAGGDRCVPPASGRLPKGAVMDAEVRLLTPRVVANDMHESIGALVSTLSLCNANFGRS